MRFVYRSTANKGGSRALSGNTRSRRKPQSCDSQILLACKTPQSAQCLGLYGVHRPIGIYLATNLNCYYRIIKRPDDGCQLPSKSLTDVCLWRRLGPPTVISVSRNATVPLWEYQPVVAKSLGLPANKACIILSIQESLAVPGQHGKRCFARTLCSLDRGGPVW